MCITAVYMTNCRNTTTRPRTNGMNGVTSCSEGDVPRRKRSLAARKDQLGTRPIELLFPHLDSRANPAALRPGERWYPRERRHEPVGLNRRSRCSPWDAVERGGKFRGREG